MTYNLAIQIINYNTKAYLKTCLDSLLKDMEGTAISYIINVLDNNSNDDLSDLESFYDKNKVRFYNSKINYGFGGGHNYLSKQCDSEYILILNSDILFIEDKTVERLYKTIAGSAEYKASGPRLVVESYEQQPFDHGELKGFMAYLKNNYGASYWKPRKEPVDSAWVSGAVFLVETAVFKGIGGFDEKFFLYKEEEDLCIRIRAAGAKILYDPRITVMHYGHVVARRSIHFDNSMNYYLDKHFRHKLVYKILHGMKVVKDVLRYGKVRQRE
jgi:GT2 family glycosyltransferase